jgi:hypothetical protein
MHDANVAPVEPGTAESKISNIAPWRANPNPRSP